jgi:L-asparaginase
MPAIRDLVSSGVLVTVSSRCVAGRVRPRYGYAGGGHDLAAAGAILAGDLSGAKARLLLMVALGTDAGSYLELWKTQGTTAP